VDLDGNRFGDFFLFNRSTGQWFQVAGHDGPGFGYPAFGAWSTDWAFTFGDYNGDRLTDVLLLRASGQWFVATIRPGGFTYTSGFWSAGWQPHAGDFDGDRREDLFLINPLTGQWFVMLGDGLGGFTPSSSGFWSAGWDVRVTQLDSDGRADVLLYSASSGQWFRCLNRGPGVFEYASGFWSVGLDVIVSKN
jgi:hypothetical protein